MQIFYGLIFSACLDRFLKAPLTVQYHFDDDKIYLKISIETFFFDKETF